MKVYPRKTALTAAVLFLVMVFAAPVVSASEDFGSYYDGPCQADNIPEMDPYAEPQDPPMEEPQPEEPKTDPLLEVKDQPEDPHTPPPENQQSTEPEEITPPDIPQEVEEEPIPPDPISPEEPSPGNGKSNAHGKGFLRNLLRKTK
ncbi:MAG: hypothetical protein JSW00_08670 [Thermoplasmata archaeon]|nr:MAG: hypothetical protein JSW00_08670 [Thermoplasmata archaeon]